MTGKDIIMISQEKLKRLHIIKKVTEGKMKQVEASEILSLTHWQVKRVVKRGTEG